MFVKGELSRERELKRRKKYLKGKNTKQKFTQLYSEAIETLATIKPLMNHVNADVQKKFEAIITDAKASKQTTSDERALDSLLECHDDIETLKDEMKHGLNKHTHDKRLSAVLQFLRDFHSTTYTPYKDPYESDSSTVGKQIETVAKTFHYKAAKLQNEMAKKEEEMLYFERENQALADSLSGLPKQSVEYTTTANKIKGNHKTITALKSHLNTLRKNHSMMDHFAQMFEQLAINEAYHNNLKSEGPIRKLINRIHRNPEALDVMSDTTELADALSRMKEELSEIESIIEPAQKMAFDNEDDVDEDLIAQYQSTNKS